MAQKTRPVLYHLQKPLKEWIEQGVKEEIFEKVQDSEAITWCSPLVVQPKPKYTDVKKEELKSQMIRASIDMRIPNKSMKRSWCVQSPRVEDFIYRLHDCKVFTKLDLRQGYHQQHSALLGETTDHRDWCLERNHHRMSLTRQCLESLETYLAA